MADATGKIVLGLSFCGAAYRGFQFQDRGRTVQAELEKALKKVGFDPKAAGCSRTDGGVHARRYVAHARDRDPRRSSKELLKGLNSNLPPDIRVHSVCRGGPDFHARYSSHLKCYRYFIHLGDAVPPPAEPFVAKYFADFDPVKAVSSLSLFEGERDYGAFTTSDGRKQNTLRTVSSVSILGLGPLVCFEVRGGSFLHRMVRFMVGAVLARGRDKVAVSFLEEALSGKAVPLPFPAAAAQGLHLWDVDYDRSSLRELYEEDHGLPLWPFEGLEFTPLACPGRP